MKFYKEVFLAAMLFFAVHLWLPALSFSCQPCRAKLNFQETVKRADLIIIGKKVADEGPMVRAGRGYSSPEGGKIKIFRVLKGKTGRDTIDVRCMYGMCGYGICLQDDSLHVIFLSAVQSEGGGYDYTSVHSGCAVKHYRVVDNKVVMDSETVPMSEFENMVLGR
jgi:hypothetical protein